MDLNTTWFLLIGFLLAGYAVLDGFDLGVGVLHLFARDDRSRRIYMNAIGPVWDGNEVWLLAGGGALFAAFPIVYATVFSGLYLAVMLLLFALIFRAVSLEFRSQVDSRAWQRFWDWAFGLGSLVPAVLYGVVMGNVLRGLPVDADGALNVSFLALLNPYSLLIGAFSLLTFVMHGAAFLSLKTEGDLQERMARSTIGAWMAVVVLCPAATVATFFTAPFLLDGTVSSPIFWILFAVLLGAGVSIPVAVHGKQFTRGFLASAAAIVSIIGLMALSLYPRMVPSSTDLANSLTIYNASSTPRTLTVTLVIALVGMPLVVGYTAWVYKIFAGKVVLTKDGY